MRQVGAEAQITVWRQKRRSSGCENAQSWDVSNVSGKPCFESFFANGVEDLPLFLINTVSATGIGIKQSLLPCKIVDPSSWVESWDVRDLRWSCARHHGARGKQQWLGLHFEAFWRKFSRTFSVRKLLEWAGNYNLDDFNDGNVVEIRPGTKIRLRHTGFILTVRFRCSEGVSLRLLSSFRLLELQELARGLSEVTHLEVRAVLKRKESNERKSCEEYWDYKTFPWDWRPSEPQCSLEVELQPQAWGFTGADPDPEGSILRTDSSRLYLSIMSYIVYVGIKHE